MYFKDLLIRHQEDSEEVPRYASPTASGVVNNGTSAKHNPISMIYLPT